jgi:hypothetical protein
MKNSILLFSSSLALFFSCSTNSTKQEIVSELASQKLGIPEVINPLDINYLDSDSLLYVTDATSLHWVAAYDSRGLFLGSFALKGEGPNELISSQKFQEIRDRKSIVLTDRTKNSFFTYIRETGSQLPTLKSVIKIKGTRLKSPIVLAENEFIDFNTDIASSSLLVKFDSMGTILKRSLDYPDTGYKMEPYLYQEAYSGYISYFPDHQTILVNLFYSDLVYLFNENLELLAKYQTEKPFYPKFKGLDNGFNQKIISPDFETSKYGFISKAIQLDNENYLIGFSGKSAKEGESISELIQFNKNLKPVKKFLLDKPITRFTYSKKLNRIYAMSENTEGGFLVFDLN